MIQPYEKRQLMDAEIAKLNDLEKTLNHEFEQGGLTAAQRLTVLSEIRKLIALRATIAGVIQPPEFETH